MNKKDLFFLFLAAASLSLALEPVGSAFFGLLSLGLLFHTLLRFGKHPNLLNLIIQVSFFSISVSFLNFYWVFWGIYNLTGIGTFHSGFLFFLFSITLYYKLLIPYFGVWVFTKFTSINTKALLIFILPSLFFLADLCPMIFPLYWGDLFRNNIVFRQFAIFGVEALGLSVLLISGFSYLAFFYRKKLFREILFFLTPIFFFFCTNLIILSKEIQADFNLNLALIQPNTEYSKNINREDTKFLTNVLQNFFNLGMEAYQTSPQPLDLIVFPESAVPFLGTHKSENLEKTTYSVTFEETIKTLSQNTKSNILFNELVWDNGSRNSASLLRADESNIHRRYKQILLPFGEYIPFEKYFPLLRTLFSEASDHKPGNTFDHLASVSKSNETFYFQPLICYEILFPNLVREKSIDLNVQFLVNLTNDSWFLSTRESKLHAGAGRLRAIESGLPLVRVAVTGLTQGFDPWGRDILGEIPMNLRAIGFLSLPIHKRSNLTPFLKYGPFPFRIFAIFLLFFGILYNSRALTTDENEK